MGEFDGELVGKPAIAADHGLGADSISITESDWELAPWNMAFETSGFLVREVPLQGQLLFSPPGEMGGLHSFREHANAAFGGSGGVIFGLPDGTAHWEVAADWAKEPFIEYRLCPEKRWPPRTPIDDVAIGPDGRVESFRITALVLATRYEGSCDDFAIGSHDMVFTRVA